MAIRACFALLICSLLFLLAPGAIRPVAADSYPTPAAAIEYEAVPSFRDYASGLELLWVERLAEDGGSGASMTEVAVTEDAADAWAEAFAESSRLRATIVAPPYPLVINGAVQAFIERFTGTNRDVVELWLNRSSRYLSMIRDVLRNQGLPEDLAFVAMIESGYNPLAVSRAGAKGMWQFMAGTARRYGLRVDQWVDERLDPEKSTAAAAKYLRDLYQQFGSWALAKAAYNAGEVKIIRAMRVAGSTDFWALARTRLLRQETREFVPAIHAATVIGRDPQRFGFTPNEYTPVFVDKVTVPASTNLKTLATGAGLSDNTLRTLNPVLVRGTTPPGGSYELKVPAGSRDAIRTALAPKPKPTVARGSRRGPTAASRKAVSSAASDDVHVVQPRETVSSIADQYGVAVGDVLRWNGLEKQAVIRPGDRLRVAEVRFSAEGAGQTGAR
jgi:membrane-bound lytic murein transglycosylase D